MIFDFLKSFINLLFNISYTKYAITINIVVSLNLNPNVIDIPQSIENNIFFLVLVCLLISKKKYIINRHINNDIVSV